MASNRPLIPPPPTGVIVFRDIPPPPSGFAVAQSEPIPSPPSGTLKLDPRRNLGINPENLALAPTRLKALGAAAITGAAEAIPGLAAAAIDATPLVQGYRAIQAVRGKKTEPMPLTSRVGEFFTRNVQEPLKEAIGVQPGVDTRRAEKWGRIAGDVAVPIPPVTKIPKVAKVLREGLRGAKAVETAGEATKVAETVASVPADPVTKITTALKEAKPVRAEAEAMYTAERGRRIEKAVAVGKETGGEKGFHAELAQLRGELPKPKFEPIRGIVDQADIDSLFNQVKDSLRLSEWDKISARSGLAKLFGEMGGQVPTNSEIELLSKVFPKEFTQTILSKRPTWERVKEGIYEVANVPRSLMSSLDLSAPFRQGVFFIGRPKQFFPAFVDMFKAFGSEKAFKAINDDIVARPTFPLMRDSKLAITDPDALMSGREEQFMSNFAEKIPVVGVGVRASARAYTGFLNKLRADVFDDLVKKAEVVGRNPREDPQLTKELANFINAATGRGNLGSLAGASKALNAFFFSPRLMASRLTLLNPGYYVKADSFVRKEALKSLFTFAGTWATVGGLAKLGGAEVGLDPRSSDFAKIKIGSTRFDIGGGFQQYIRAAAQLATGKYISPTTGKQLTLGEGYKPITRMDILTRLIESKEAPVASFFTTLLKQQDYRGQPISIQKEIRERFTPMVAQDLYEIAREEPELLPPALLAFFGVGVQRFEKKK